MSTESLTVRLPTEDLEAINSLSRQTGKSKTYIARTAIKQYCLQEEWYQSELQKGLDDITKGRFSDIEEVENYWLEQTQE